MSLAAQIDSLNESMAGTVPPEVLAAFGKAAEELAASGVVGNALPAGATAPPFELPNAQGKNVRLDDLLIDGPVVLTFYRGLWCPYCNLTLAALQREFAQIRTSGAALVAVSPQTPSATEETAQSLGAAFHVLSDQGNKVARAYGLVFSLSEAVRPIYLAMGADLPKINGDFNYELPLAATYIIGRDHKIKHSFVESDYTRRMEPSEITRVVKSL